MSFPSRQNDIYIQKSIKVKMYLLTYKMQCIRRKLNFLWREKNFTDSRRRTLWWFKRFVGICVID